MIIDDALWARVVALIPKLQDKKAKKDKAKDKDLNKLSKADLIKIVKEITL